MIARLVGRLVAHEGHRGILDVRDVGYAIHAPLGALASWARSEVPVEVHVVTDVREDAIVLYGFATDLDRRGFEALREVTGVGPKLALSAIDALGLEGIAKAVAADDIATLSRPAGVGKKLAQRLALELKGKLVVGFETTTQVAQPAPKDDALDLALARLGYGRAEILRARERLADEGIETSAPVADRLRAALRLLSGGGGA